jgi:hypothetical protein
MEVKHSSKTAVNATAITFVNTTATATTLGSQTQSALKPVTTHELFQPQLPIALVQLQLNLSLQLHKMTLYNITATISSDGLLHY